MKITQRAEYFCHIRSHCEKEKIWNQSRGFALSMCVCTCGVSVCSVFQRPKATSKCTTHPPILHSHSPHWNFRGNTTPTMQFLFKHPFQIANSISRSRVFILARFMHFLSCVRIVWMWNTNTCKKSEWLTTHVFFDPLRSAPYFQGLL